MHKHYYSFKANSHYDLGLQMGRAFKTEAKAAVEKNIKEGGFDKRIKTAKKMLLLAESHFPEYIQEARGYAEGAGVGFAEFWTLVIEDDAYIEEEKPAKCTTMITNNGKLIAHSEDWSPESANDIWVIEKTVGQLTNFEIYYANTLGGGSVGVNSNEFVYTANSLFFKSKQIGTPKAMLWRMFSDTKNPVSDFKKIKHLKLADGYNENIVSLNGEIINIEMAARESILTKPKSPFVHTNHCLLLKDSLKPKDDYIGTFTRLDFTKEKVSQHNTVSEIKDILEDNSFGTDKSVNNKRTIGRMIVDLENLLAHIWLLREKELGWIEYPLDFITK